MAVNLRDASFLTKSQLNTIYSVLENLKAKDKDVTIEPLGGVGENFVADVKIMKIKDHDGKNNDFKIFLKVSPSSRQVAMSNLTDVFFNNEIIMYNEVLLAFSACQESAGVESKDAFRFPTCYGLCTERQNEILLLEDLTKFGYTMLDKFKPLSNETFKLVLTRLADYHSMSYALKNKSPETYMGFAKRLKDMNDALEVDALKEYNVMGDNFSKICTKEKHKNLVKYLFSMQSLEKTTKLKEADAGSKYSVIIHGDTWTNNILFKVDDDKTTDCVLIDYQLAKESMPAADILFLIFHCTTHEGRSKHYDEWLTHYHTQLEKSLFNFGLRINNVYPRDRLDSDMITYTKTVLTRAIVTMSILLRRNEDTVHFKKAIDENQDVSEMMNSMKVTSLNADTIASIKDRLEKLLDSCFELGLVQAN